MSQESEKFPPDCISLVFLGSHQHGRSGLGQGNSNDCPLPLGSCKQEDAEDFLPAESDLYSYSSAFGTDFENSKILKPGPQREKELGAMLNQLVAWATAPKTLRIEGAGAASGAE